MVSRMMLLLFLLLVSSSFAESQVDYLERMKETVRDDCAACTVVAVSILKLLDQGVDAVHNERYFFARLRETTTKDYIYDASEGHWHSKDPLDATHRSPDHRMENYIESMINEGPLMGFLAKGGLVRHGHIDSLHDQLCVRAMGHCTPFSPHSTEL